MRLSSVQVAGRAKKEDKKKENTHTKREGKEKKRNITKGRSHSWLPPLELRTGQWYEARIAAALTLSRVSVDMSLLPRRYEIRVVPKWGYGGEWSRCSDRSLYPL